MNKKRIFILGAGFLLILGIAASTTYMCLQHFSNCQSHGAPVGISSAHEWVHQVGLSPEQEKKIDPYEVALKKDLQAIQIKLANERIALCRLIQEEPADSKKVTEYTQRVSAIEAKQQKLVINHLIVMRDILNPEQRGKLFASIMHEICVGCRQMVAGQKCICGMCDMKGHAK